MADKMMKIAGRTEDGIAKAISVSTDNEGNGVLRVVDAAPFAFVDDGGVGYFKMMSSKVERLVIKETTIPYSTIVDNANYYIGGNNAAIFTTLLGMKNEFSKIQVFVRNRTNGDVIMPKSGMIGAYENFWNSPIRAYIEKIDLIGASDLTIVAGAIQMATFTVDSPYFALKLRKGTTAPSSGDIDVVVIGIA